MPSFKLTREHSAGRNALQPGAARERALLGLVILALAQSSTALCEEPSAFTAHPRGLPDPNLPFTSAFGTGVRPEAAAPPYLQDAFGAPRMPDDSGFSSKEFRPRAPSINDSPDRTGTPAEPALIRSTTVWQRLSEYRSRDRVRVLTLWESGASTVSLQAGKKGDPSLQWTSRLMNRGGATRGLLDRLFAVSVAGASSGLRGESRIASTAQATAKPMRMEAAAK